MYVRIASQEKLHSGAGSSNAREGASDQNNGVCISELLGGQFMGQRAATQINMGVRIARVKRFL